MIHQNEGNGEPSSNRKKYRGYAGLPPLVGLETMEEALTKGLTVGESVARLKRLHWSLRRLHGILIAHIASVPVYELKMAFSLHAHYAAEYVLALAARVREMRQPPYGLEVSPDLSLDLFFDEILSAPTTPALVAGIYDHAVPAIVEALQQFLDRTNRLFDHPSYRLCRLAMVEFEEVLIYGRIAVECVVGRAEREELAQWESLLGQALASAGGLDGTGNISDKVPERQFSGQPFHFDPVPKRDERFQDSYNMGVNAEAFIFDPKQEAQPKTLMLFYKRMREIDVPEMMSSILHEGRNKPWEYQRDLTRQLWDEARHAMMGEIGFYSLGVDWKDVPLNFTWSLGLNTQLTAKERYAVLYTIEQGLMPKKTGKEYEWEVAVASADPLAARIQDYDWADEVLHARIGREWLVPEIGSQVEALKFGDEAWSRVLSDWKRWREEGLTEHRNWWPRVYREACKHWGVDPDPLVLAYNKTYEGTRADLKQLAE